MIPLGFILKWRRLAAFYPSWTAHFAKTQNRVTKVQEVRPSSRRCASKCQNRYPSPSRWPDQILLVRSLWFCSIQRVHADFQFKTAAAIEYQRRKELLCLRETSPKKNRGTSKCTNHLFCSRPWQVLLAAPKALILSALLLAAQLVALLANCWRMANALPARQSVPQAAHWPTTSKAQLRLNKPPCRLHGRVKLPFGATHPTFLNPIGGAGELRPVLRA